MDETSDFKPTGWHNRGYLPHFDAGEVFQSITFRLHDSMPQSLLEAGSVNSRLNRLSLKKSCVGVLRLTWIKATELVLSDDRIANLVQNSLLHFDTERYRLSAWVVMPNHVHLLAAPCYAYSLSDIMHSIKSYTAQQANKILGRKGRFWFEDYFDRYIRNAKHFENAISYIENNPVKAGLCHTPREWQFSSAWHRAHLHQTRVGSI